MERELVSKIKEAEESDQKLVSLFSSFQEFTHPSSFSFQKEERLQMLEVKGKLEMERAEIQRERDAAQRAEQHSILNKGGLMRAPIKLKLGGAGSGFGGAGGGGEGANGANSGASALRR